MFELTDEIIEFNVTRAAEIAGSTPNYIHAKIEDIKNIYHKAELTEDKKGRIYNDIYEVELLHLYILGYEDGLLACKNAMEKYS